jgi:hypothetical protein
MLLKSTLTLVALAAATLVSGCEPPCRRGVAKAFADSYAPVVQETVLQLNTNLKVSLFESTSAPVQITSVVPESAIQDAVHGAVKKTLDDYLGRRVTDNTLEKGIYNTMFNEQDPFKGDCNHPKRLTRNMPPEGESWTLEECKLLQRKRENKRWKGLSCCCLFRCKDGLYLW